MTNRMLPRWNLRSRGRPLDVFLLGDFRVATGLIFQLSPHLFNAPNCSTFAVFHLLDVYDQGMQLKLIVRNYTIRSVQSPAPGIIIVRIKPLQYA